MKYIKFFMIFALLLLFSCKSDNAAQKKPKGQFIVRANFNIILDGDQAAELEKKQGEIQSLSIQQNTGRKPMPGMAMGMAQVDFSISTGMDFQLRINENLKTGREVELKAEGSTQVSGVRKSQSLMNDLLLLDIYTASAEIPVFEQIDEIKTAQVQLNISLENYQSFKNDLLKEALNKISLSENNVEYKGKIYLTALSVIKNE